MDGRHVKLEVHMELACGKTLEWEIMGKGVAFVMGNEGE